MTSASAWSQRSHARPHKVSVEIDVENGHREIVGQIAVLVVAEDDAQKLVTEINLCRIVLPRPRLDHHLLVEDTLEIAWDLLSTLPVDELTKVKQDEISSYMKVKA